MIAGIIDKSTGTRDIYDLHGLYKKMPITAIVTLLALISMAGLPPMLGFLGKELIYEAKMQLPDVSWLLLPLGVGANIMMVAISITVFYELFIPDKKRKPVEFKYKEKELPLRFILGPILLAIVGLFLGLSPKILETPVDNGLFFMGYQNPEISLSLWHGFNDVLLLSIFTVLSGVFIFYIRRPVTRFIRKIINWLDRFHLPTLFSELINKYLKTAAKNTNLLQHGYHRFYLLTFFLTVIALMGIQIFRITDVQLPELKPSPIKIHVALLLLVTASSVIFAVFAKSRLSAIIAMGVVGYGIAMLYLYYGAVDLAITQFLAETVLMVLFVMVIYYLPEFAILSNKKSRVRDGLISIGVGVFITLVVLKAKFLNLETPISEFYAANAYTEAHGRNIVNVILVDFRALDTMGELTVLTLAAAGVYSLFRFQIKTLKKKKTGTSAPLEDSNKKIHE
jgi:multicomponent Na+:H+ antiporter subunit A